MINQEKLSRWQSIASITASIAIPLILAIFGFLVQNQIASEGLRKDYVQIAISILKENPSAQEKDLRKWAVSVLDENSPIPFSATAKTSLEKGLPSIISKLVFPPAPAPCMIPPANLRLYTLINASMKNNQLDLGDPEAFLKSIIDESYKAEMNSARLKCLQDWIQNSKTIVEELDAKVGILTGAPVESPK